MFGWGAIYSCGLYSGGFLIHRFGGWLIFGGGWLYSKFYGILIYFSFKIDFLNCMFVCLSVGSG